MQQYQQDDMAALGKVILHVGRFADASAVHGCVIFMK